MIWLVKRRSRQRGLAVITALQTRRRLEHHQMSRRSLTCVFDMSERRGIVGRALDGSWASHEASGQSRLAPFGSGTAFFHLSRTNAGELPAARLRLLETFQPFQLSSWPSWPRTRAWLINSLLEANGAWSQREIDAGSSKDRLQSGRC